MKKIVLTLDLYTKIILTIIAVTTTGLLLSFSFGSKEVSAKNENVQVNIAQVGGKLVSYGGPISVKSQ